MVKIEDFFSPQEVQHFNDGCFDEFKTISLQSTISNSVSANTIFLLVRKLVMILVERKQNIRDYNKEKEIRAGTLIKFSENQRQNKSGGKNKVFVLNGHVLDYYDLDKKQHRPKRTIILTPDQFVCDGSFAGQFSFEIHTVQGALYLTAASLKDKLEWVNLISRAICFQESNSNIRAPLMNVPPRTESFSIQAVAVPQITGEETNNVGAMMNGEFKSKLEAGANLMSGYLLKKTVNRRKERKFPQLFKTVKKRYFVLFRNSLNYWNSESECKKGFSPVSSLFLDYATTLNVKSPNELEVVTFNHTLILIAPGNDGAGVMKQWEDAIRTSVLHLRSFLFVLESYQFQEKERRFSEVKKPPPIITPVVATSFSSMPVDTHQSAASYSDAVETPVLVKDESMPAAPAVKVEELIMEQNEQIKIVVTESTNQPEKQREDDDPRLCFYVYYNNEADFIGTIKADAGDSLCAFRMAIHSQWENSKIPLRFVFLNAAKAVIANSLETEIKITDIALRVEGDDAPNHHRVLLDASYCLFEAEQMDWQSEKLAYELEIRALQAQIVELKLMLDSARRGITKEEMNKSSLYSMIYSLKNDGYVGSEVNLQNLELAYHRAFTSEDISKILLSSQSPFRIVIRKYCGDPEKLREFLEDLQTFVLVKYKIKANRFSSPFWSKTLREPRLLNNSKEFAEWAKSEPWCEDNNEKYVYLTSKMVVGYGDNADDFLILHPRPSNPITTTTLDSKEAGAEDEKHRPTNPQANIAMAAMKELQKRKSSRKEKEMQAEDAML